VPDAEIDASVLIPVLNEAGHLPEAAPRMFAQRFDGEIEFLFIDGGSSDDTVALVEEMARSDRRVRLLHNPEGHTPAALNIGLAAARGRYVVRMDAHTLYPADYIASGVKRHQRGDVAHVSGPQLARSYDEGSRLVTLVLASKLGVGSAGFRHAAGEREVDSGFTGVWEREPLVALGGWDEQWRINQDTELAARIRAGGGRIVCIPEMAAHYLPRNSLRGLARQYWRYGRYRSRTALRHPHSFRRAHVLPPGVAAAALVALLPGPLGRLARRGLAVYLAAVLAESARLALTEPDGRPQDAGRLPAYFLAMHLPWGAGYLTTIAQAVFPSNRDASSAAARATE
jgi:succinoglycan biosynthesis protein ExoA